MFLLLIYFFIFYSEEQVQMAVPFYLAPQAILGAQCFVVVVVLNKKAWTLGI